MLFVRMMTRLWRVPLWVWWIPVVLVVSFPVGLTTEPQWDRAHPLPFTDPADKVLDFVLNLLLFVPFGYSLMRWRASLALVLLGATTTSLVAELLQVFSQSRFPSGTDVVSGTAGALVGALVAGGRHSGAASDKVATTGRSHPSN